MSEAFPPVSVIVPTRNRPQLVSKAVESIASGDERPAEIVVVERAQRRTQRGRRGRRACDPHVHR